MPDLLLNELREAIDKLTDDSYHLTQYTYLLPDNLPEENIRSMHKFKLRKDSIFGISFSRSLINDGLKHLTILEVTKINNQVLLTFPIIDGVSIKFNSVSTQELLDLILPMLDDESDKCLLSVH